MLFLIGLVLGVVTSMALGYFAILQPLNRMLNDYLDKMLWRR